MVSEVISDFPDAHVSHKRCYHCELGEDIGNSGQFIYRRELLFHGLPRNSELAR
jgi:hypothetical protein